MNWKGVALVANGLPFPICWISCDATLITTDIHMSSTDIEKDGHFINKFRLMKLTPETVPLKENKLFEIGLSYERNEEPRWRWWHHHRPTGKHDIDNNNFFQFIRRMVKLEIRKIHHYFIHVWEFVHFLCCYFWTFIIHRFIHIRHLSQWDWYIKLW